MPAYLAVDFGTTSTKSALVDVETGALADVRHHPAIPPSPGPPRRFEVPLEAIRDRFLGLCASYANGLGASLAGIVICSEMHGFALVDDAGRPRTPRPGPPAPDFWPRLAAIDAPDLAGATLDVDLAVFSGAWGYRDGGHVARIEEGTLTVRNYLASVLRAFVEQYGRLLPHLDPDRRLGRLVLSGGLARRLPALPRLLEAATGYAVTPPTAIDESLLGLRALALVAAGLAPTARAAQAVFGRDVAATGTRR